MPRTKPDTSRTCPGCRGTGNRKNSLDNCGLCHGNGRINF